jgi:hypothetical protein
MTLCERNGLDALHLAMSGNESRLGANQCHHLPLGRKLPGRVQIEFYFSDSNLPFDKFLKEQCASDGGCAPPEWLV